MARRKQSSNKRTKSRQRARPAFKSFTQWARYFQDQLQEFMRFAGGVILALITMLGLLALIEPITSGISQIIWPTISIKQIINVVAFVGVFFSLVIVVFVILVIWIWRSQEEQATQDRLKQKHAGILSNVQKNLELLIRLENS